MEGERKDGCEAQYVDQDVGAGLQEQDDTIDQHDRADNTPQESRALPRR